MNIERLSQTARYAAKSDAHWTAFFEALHAELPVDRICAALQLDEYTAYLPRVAQVPELEPLLGSTGLYADRERSRTFDVISEGTPFIATTKDWEDHPDLAFYSVAVKANLKFPVSFGGHATVLNLWSRTEGAFTPEHLKALEPVAAELSRSPFVLELEPVGLSLRKVAALIASRQQALAA